MNSWRSDYTPKPEVDYERQARIQRETMLVTQGLGLDESQLEDWLDALDRDEDTPLPDARRPARSD